MMNFQELQHFVSVLTQQVHVVMHVCAHSPSNLAVEFTG